MTNDRLSKKLFDAVIITIVMIISMFILFEIVQAIHSFETNFKLTQAYMENN